MFEVLVLRSRVDDSRFRVQGLGLQGLRLRF